MEETMTVVHAPMMPADRKANGKRLRDHMPRDANAGWRAHAGRADPIGILRAADAARQPDLVPLRYGRVLQSPSLSTVAPQPSWQPNWPPRR